MNLASWAVTAVIAVCFILAVRHMYRMFFGDGGCSCESGGVKCAGCKETGCPFCKKN